MNKNLKTPENIDKLISNQASEPSFLDNVFSGYVVKETSANKNSTKVYKKVYKLFMCYAAKETAPAYRELNQNLFEKEQIT